MGLLLPLVLCALATGCRATSVPLTPPPFPFLPRGCNESDVLTAAGFALQDINRDLKDGYVLSLNRVNDACEHRQDNLGSLFYLTLDVLETDCHVLTRKAWKDCRVRNIHISVYGQCKAILHVNEPAGVLHLTAYNCTLRPVSQRNIEKTEGICSSCPRLITKYTSDPKVLEVALDSLIKYNSESPWKQYFLVQVTQAYSQVVVDSCTYSVEYLIKESPCNKSQASNCPFCPPDSERERDCKQAERQAEREEEEASLPSREPDAGLDPRTLKS